jgi:hypothetical protein
MPDEINTDPEAIYQKILPRLFNDSNDAYVYEITDSEQLMHYFIYHVIKAMAVTYIKAETQEVTLRLLGGKDKQAIGMLKLINTPDYPDFGNTASIWYIPSRTQIGADLFLPCAVRVNPDEEKAMINDWKRVTPVVGDVFTTTRIEHMEVMSDVFDPKENKETYVLYDLSTNDARLEKIAFKRETALVFRFRYFGMNAVMDDAMNVADNDLAFLMAQFTGCATVLKKGYILDVVPRLCVEPSLINVLKELPPFEGAIIEPEGTTPTQAEIHAQQSKQPVPPPSMPSLETQPITNKK